MVVRVDAGRDAVRAYVQEQASQGLDHVRALVGADTARMVSLIEDLSEEQGTQAPAPGEWSIAEVLVHLNTSLERSRARLETMSSGREWTNPPGAGQPDDSEAYRTFADLRREYIEGMAAISAVLDGADPGRGLDLTADHAQYGLFNWLEWAVYSHHVHTHDHIGQTQDARARVRGEA